MMGCDDMSKLLGLKYVGYRSSGVALMLYNSYNTVRLDSLHPYIFTESDDTSDEAKKFYESISDELSIELVISN
jgi:hypothetical protein